jgi:hypothetical protein
MSTTGDSPRSLAVELARLFLRELEALVAQDPERLVSTEAVLSFAAVRRADPLTWQHWCRILEQYEKLALLEYMLDEPVSFTILTSTAGLLYASTAIGRITRSAPGHSNFSCSGPITGRPATAPARKQSAPR